MKIYYKNVFLGNFIAIYQYTVNLICKTGNTHFLLNFEKMTERLVGPVIWC